jgi:predicted house-cleaning noncanonical NTP pyrophosphatase (MazG superfamily)
VPFGKQPTHGWRCAEVLRRQIEGNVKLVAPFKLVRDNIPNLIREKGGWCLTKTLKGETYRKALADKVVEEACELRKAKTETERVLELADLMEAIDAYRSANMIRDIDVLAVRRTRGITRGVFAKGIKLLLAV